MGITESYLQGLAEVASWGVVTTDTQLTITGWNRWLETNCNILARDVVGRNLLDVFLELRTRQQDRYFRQALAGQTVILSHRLHRYLLPLPPSVTGSGFPFMQQSARIAPLLQEGQVVGTVTVIEDVTERVMQEIALGARAREQSAIATLSQLALAGDDLEALFQETIETIAKVFSVDFCEVLSILPDGQTLHSRAATGLGELHSGTGTMPTGTDLFAGHTFLTRSPVIVEDLLSDSRLQVQPMLRELGVISAAARTWGH